MRKRIKQLFCKHLDKKEISYKYKVWDTVFEAKNSNWDI